MSSTKMTGRVIRTLAIVALAATPVIVLTTASPVGAVTPVTDQDGLRGEFENNSVAEIDLGADIVIDTSGDSGCDQMYRDSGVALVINGNGHTIHKDEADCADDGQDGERIFRQRGDGMITFENVTVTGGTKIGGEGGALKTDGPVTVTNSTFSDNSALRCNYKDDAAQTDVEADNYCGSPDGGAIFADGAVTITGSTFSGNLAERSGGAVFTDENIVVNNSTFSGNTVHSDSRCFCSGGAFVTYGGADVTSSEITGNSATCDHYCGAEGGGFWAANFTSVVSSVVSGNTASCGYGCSGMGGGFSGAGFSENSFASETAKDVGAAAADPGNIVVQNSVISGNTASCTYDGAFLTSQGGGDVCGAGGGFAAVEADTVTVDHSTISGNQALCVLQEADVQAAGQSEICGGGGGFYFADVNDVNVNASTLNGNTATIFGGALGSFPALGSGSVSCDSECSPGTDVALTNSTVTANTGGEFAAIFVLGSEGDTLTLVHDTIVANTIDLGLLTPLLGTTATGPDPLAANVLSTELTSFGTIVAQPKILYGTVFTPADAVAVNSATNSSSASEGYNFSDDDSCQFDQATDIVHTPNDPVLLALGNYGGPTQTMRPAGQINTLGQVVGLSPVVDKIPAAACRLNVDQRGVTRPQFVIANVCDIGAVEITAAEITVSPEVVAVVLTPKFTG